MKCEVTPYGSLLEANVTFLVVTRFCETKKTLAIEQLLEVNFAQHDKYFLIFERRIQGIVKHQ